MEKLITLLLDLSLYLLDQKKRTEILKNIKKVDGWGGNKQLVIENKNIVLSIAPYAIIQFFVFPIVAGLIFVYTLYYSFEYLCYYYEQNMHIEALFGSVFLLLLGSMELMAIYASLIDDKVKKEMRYRKVKLLAFAAITVQLANIYFSR